MKFTVRVTGHRPPNLEGVAEEWLIDVDSRDIAESTAARLRNLGLTVTILEDYTPIASDNANNKGKRP